MEDNRASKKIYGSRLTDLFIEERDGKQLTYSDNSSSETDFSTPVLLKQMGKFILLLLMDHLHQNLFVLTKWMRI